MSEEPQNPQTEEGGGIGYTPSQLPPPVSGADFYMRAMLVELRLMRNALQRMAKANETTAKAAQEQARASQDQARSAAKAVRK
jgi:hypothetical protein